MIAHPFEAPVSALSQPDTLRFRIYENALLLPSASRTVYRNIDGAVFDSELHPIESSFLTRTWEQGQISFAPELAGLDLSHVERIEEPHVYGGYFFDHFGHFLLESLARAWVVDELGPMPFTWASGGPANRWQTEVLTLLGLTGSQRFPDRPVLFRQLVIPEPGYRIQGYFHPRHAEFLACFATEGRQGTSQKIWLSRTGAPASGRSRGEGALQEYLATRKWRIVDPQRLSVAEQLRIFAQAGVVAGLEGSAFHAVVLLKGPSAPLVTLRRTTNSNYSAIAERKGIVALDLYGAFRIHDRTDVSLVRPLTTARTIDELAERVARCRDDPSDLRTLKETAEAAHDFARWERQQRRRWIAHARSQVRKKKLAERLRSAMGRRLPWLKAPRRSG